MESKLNIGFSTDENDFDHWVGRKPRNQKEFDDWVHYLEKGVEAQLDWDIIYDCASNNFGSDEE